ncbi:MAG: hypothetical protein KDB61_00775 [Planctomycetes bacterium]|nr:hypothetical protein [Planctomycetota bacterium]
MSRNHGPIPEDRRRPRPDHFDAQHPLFERVMAAHDAAMAAGQARYLDPISGQWVETAETIWRSRECCDLGCRHCPYGPR